MKCNDCLLVIEEYFDGELDEHQTQTIDTHLFICMACSKTYKRLQSEQNVYNNYQRNIVISPSLRSAIEARLGEQIRKPQTRMSWLEGLIKSLFNTPNLVPIFVAVSLILVTVVTTIMVMKNFSKLEVNKDPVASATPTATPATMPTITKIDGITEETSPVILEPLPAPKITITKPNKLSRSNNQAQQLIKEAEGKYLAAITILSNDAQKNYGQMSPELKASFDKSLRVIDENITQTRRAIRQSPKDPVIAQYMLAAYAKKVEVLQEIVTINENFGN
ncbi:MAG: hypothetical protein FD167_658 [bacterium]|nr:MAG: hypothetical protein FD167_658 [bacterium]